VPNALLEAAACGLPIVTTDVPGCRDVVTDGLNGLLVPVRNVPILADALETLLSDARLRQQMGTAGREIAVNKFGLDKVNEETLMIYERFL
jgi:glycosyltransferase involved in cell wall biosynthesis